jgi:DNA-binding transcriptional MerR regulator
VSQEKTNKSLLNNDSLPPIPSKKYFTIGEVGELCQLKPHVLRYWEQEFPQLNPAKRKGNRRYYQLHEVMMVRKIKELLYDQGYTIEGARQQLTVKENPKDAGAENIRILVQNTISSLEEVLEDLKVLP